MNTRIVLRVISLIMLIVAVVFIVIAASVPTLGKVIYIGKFYFGPEQWSVCYAIYAMVMVGLFLASFLMKTKR